MMKPTSNLPEHGNRTHIVRSAMDNGNRSLENNKRYSVNQYLHLITLGVRDFADTDDFRWEVAYNPFFLFNESGNLLLK